MYKSITPPTTEQILTYVSVDDLKVQLGVSHDAFDDKLTNAILTAYAWAESFTGRALLPQTLCAIFPSWGDVDITRTPLRSITTVKYYTSDAQVELPTASLRLFAGSDLCGGIQFNDTPSHDAVPDAIQVTYAAGWESHTKIPAPVKDAILMYAADQWKSRGNRPDNKLSLAERMLTSIKVIRV